MINVDPGWDNNKVLSFWTWTKYGMLCEFNIYIYSLYSGVVEVIILRCDAVSLGNWLPTFIGNIMSSNSADKHPLFTMLWTTYPITKCHVPEWNIFTYFILNILQNNKYVPLDNVSTDTHWYHLSGSCNSSLALGDQIQMGLHWGQCSLAAQCWVYRSAFVVALPLQPGKQPKPQIMYNLTYFFWKPDTPYSWIITRCFLV